MRLYMHNPQFALLDSFITSELFFLAQPFLVFSPTQIADLSEAPGVGDKKILRTLALNLGLTCTSSVVKRAIQFGTRVAKHTNVLYHGSNRKGKGDARI